MYNEEQKVRFVSTVDTIRKRDLACKVFEAFAPYEEARGADLCTMSDQDLAPVFSELFGVRTNGSPAWLAILREYFKWCVEQGIPGARTSQIKPYHIEAGKMKEKMVTTPGSLQAYLDSICEPEEKQAPDNTVRVFLWLAYIGIRDPEAALRVRSSDVDFKRFVIHLDGTDYRFYQETVPALRNCVELRQFNYFHPNYEPVMRDRVDGDYILRGIRSMPSVKTMKVEASRHAKRCKDSGAVNKQLSYERTWLSGIFYRMWDREQAGMPVDFREQAKQDVLAKFGEESEPAIVRAVNSYKADYERWKTMFV